MLKKTPLYEEHLNLKARMVDFGGWNMPVQYTGVIQEHEAVRNSAGLFDVSHMGEFEVTGPGAEAFTNYCITNDVRKLSVGQALYTALCHVNGGIVDDLVIYKVAEEMFFWVVNASNTDKDWNHVESLWKKFNGVKPKIQNVSSTYAQIALQGPLSEKILAPLAGESLTDLKNYTCKFGKIDGSDCLIARTGYTGEDGFEIYVQAKEGAKLWRSLLAAGATPCGLGARDTLRTEMKFPLYGHELTDETTPLETGLAWVVSFEKGEFCGREALENQRKTGIPRTLVFLRSEGRHIPRQGYRVFSGEKNIGVVTSGTLSPTLKKPIAIALLDSVYKAKDTSLLVEIRADKIEFKVSDPLKRKAK